MIILKILYKIYSFCIALPLFIVATALCAFFVVLFALCGDPHFMGYHAPRIWSRVTCFLFLIRVKTEGKELLDKKQSYVFLANHQGYFDIFLIYGYLGHNFKWMMKEYLKKMPFIGIACKNSRQIFVGDSRSGIQKAVEQARQTLQGGMSMMIFPEGTRTFDGKMGEFKRGAYMLAGEIGLPVVPITINGSFHIFSRKAWSVSCGTLSMKVHQPIPAEDYQKKPTKVFMQETFDIINQDIEERYRR